MLVLFPCLLVSSDMPNHSGEPGNILHLIHDDTRSHNAYKVTCPVPSPWLCKQVDHDGKYKKIGSYCVRKVTLGFETGLITNPLPFLSTQVTFQSSGHTLSAPTKNLTFSQAFVKDGRTVGASAAVQLCECESELAVLTAGGQGLELSRCQFKCHGSIRT